jgi:hypothetical protein
MRFTGRTPEYGQELWTGILQAAGFFLMPSLMPRAAKEATAKPDRPIPTVTGSGMTTEVGK